MRRLFLGLFCVFSLALGNLMAQDCQVLVKELKGTYEGDCKKGKAHGTGKAIGADVYEGTYTFKDGRIFKGSFKKGKKEGKGGI